MIIRILGEGQYRIDESLLDELNRLDAVVEAAIAADDDPAFKAGLAALLDKVRTEGSTLELDELESSDVLLPHSDTTLTEARDLLRDDGLIPG
ncbi:MAG: PspA-associated protein PspAA [Sporichthyaceae bacterium]